MSDWLDTSDWGDPGDEQRDETDAHDRSDMGIPNLVIWPDVLDPTKNPIFEQAFEKLAARFIGILEAELAKH